MGPHLAQCGLADAYLHTNWHLDSCSCLATIDMGRKLGGSSPFVGGETEGAGSPSNTMSLGSRSTFLPSGIFIHWAIWPQQIRAKIGGVPVWGRGPGFPSNTMWSGPRPTCRPSFILIRPTVWPQYTNVTERTGQIVQDMSDRQRSDGIRRTVPKTFWRVES